MALYRLGSSRTKNNSTSPGPALPTVATPRTRSVLGGPSPRRENASGFRRAFEAQGLGAHVTRRARTVAPRPRSTPSTSTRIFESRRHKSRGNPISRAGFQCGQFTVREGAQRPVIKVYIDARAPHGCRLRFSGTHAPDRKIDITVICIYLYQVYNTSSVE